VRRRHAFVNGARRLGTLQRRGLALPAALAAFETLLSAARRRYLPT